MRTECVVERVRDSEWGDSGGRAEERQCRVVSVVVNSNFMARVIRTCKLMR